MYGIGIKINAKFNYDTVACITKEGTYRGFVYFEEEGLSVKTMNYVFAANKFLSHSFSGQNDEGVLIFTKYEDTYFYLRAVADGEVTRVSIGGFADAWAKVFSNSDKRFYFDFVRYIRLMLSLCKDFSIVASEGVKLEIYITQKGLITSAYPVY
jgi:hypothetical protein